MTPEFYTARELHIILEFIAANFQDLLEDLDLDLELYVDGPTNYDFMLPVVTCQRLKRIKLKISNNLNAEIVNSLQQLTNVSTLKDVSIRFSDEEMSQELRTVLKEFGDNLKSALADRHGEFEFHLIPDLYELQ
ncbi:uncharacterized protein LOC131954232 [Physella acuta]|uniref:uncharacterized protein LOC131954232 n=1 Tax=Physella acuta TaxID=109671 RepID=UPI0027DD7CD4|nr:uncharacterized protein LOC131954232 [Physella acuta]